VRRDAARCQRQRADGRQSTGEARGDDLAAPAAALAVDERGADGDGAVDGGVDRADRQRGIHDGSSEKAAERQHVGEDSDQRVQEILAAGCGEVTVRFVPGKGSGDAQDDLCISAAYRHVSVDNEHVGGRGVGQSSRGHRRLAAIEVAAAIAGRRVGCALDEHVCALVGEQQAGQAPGQGRARLDDAEALVRQLSHGVRE
jgi:hypothetical protein